MNKLLQKVSPSADVGLNYTGGTKAMSVHAYHVLRQAFPRGCFSYLDAASLKMVINREGMPIQEIPIGREVGGDLDSLICTATGWGYNTRRTARKSLCRSRFSTTALAQMAQI